MYRNGDYVVKIPEGVCRIEDVGTIDMSGIDKNKQFYSLVPVVGSTSKIYIPVDKADGRIRSVISREEAMSFIKSIPEIEVKEISDERMREHEYKEAVLSGDYEKLVSVIKLIYTRIQKRSAQGRKATATDDRYFRQAENILFSELSFVLDIPKDRMEQFIADTIGE